VDGNLKIPEAERHKFSQPLGKLYAGTRKETLIEIVNSIRTFLKANFEIKVYLVGDIVTQDFLANDFLKDFIKLCIIDEKTQRNQITIETEEFFQEIIEFENPQGGIQKKSFTLLKEIVSSDRRTLLKITKGEEDLLVLPLVLSIPLSKKTKSLVFYGQPPITDSKRKIPEGIVMVDVEKKIQTAVKRFIDVMK